jgi:hypothetical protein
MECKKYLGDCTVHYEVNNSKQASRHCSRTYTLRFYSKSKGQVSHQCKETDHFKTVGMKYRWKSNYKPYILWTVQNFNAHRIKSRLC